MIHASFRRFLLSRSALAIGAGLLLGSAFPNLGLAGMAWLGPGLLFCLGLNISVGERFRLGYLAGLVQALVSFYWLLFIPFRWHSIPLGPAAGWLALSAYLALYPAAWLLLCSSWPFASTPRPAAENHNWLSAFDPVFKRPWGARMLSALAAGAFWVALEMLRARLFTGFPWNLLGASQYRLLPLIQIASITGIYGVSFLLVWTSVCLGFAALRLLRQPQVRSAWLPELGLPIIAISALFIFGAHQLRRSEPPGRTLRVTFVQPSIPQTLIWNPDADDVRFQQLLALSEQALTNQTELLVWPEAAVPKLLRWYKDTFEAVTGLARRHHVWMIIGADDMEPRPGARTDADRDFYNSSFLISPRGELITRYRKRSLVIFGEYVPLVRWLPFIKYLTPIEGVFTPGEKAVQFHLTDLEVATSVLICFEDIFPPLGREAATEKTDFLVNITNNGWFGESAAQWQHAISGLFRAIENGLPLLRCCNNGLTCWIDQYGRVRQIFTDSAHRIYGTGVMTAEIPLLEPNQTRVPTFYHLHGDWFGWSCVVVTSLVLAGVLARSAQRRSRGSRLTQQSEPKA